MDMAISSMPNTLGGFRNKYVEATDKLARMKARVDKIAKENAGRVEGGVRTGIVIGSGAGIAYMVGKMGTGSTPMQIMGFDGDLFIGGAALALALFEVGGEYNKFLYDIGAGGLTFYGGREAYAKGVAAQTPAAAGTPAAAAGGVINPGAWTPGRR
jgi:hypothetical protein